MPQERNEIPARGVVSILSVGQPVEDRVTLKSIFHRAAWSLCPDYEWELIAIPTLTAALAILRYGGIPIAICDREVAPGSWRELLEDAARSPAPPCVIVTARLADEQLWAEALNLGAYDVLPRPFDGHEVVRILSHAWLHWSSNCKIPVRSAAPLRLASGM